MAYNFLVSPDFTPESFAGWHMLNTLLQKNSSLAMHLLTPTSYSEQEEMLEKENVTLIYANPFDAAALIREQGYHAIARPIEKSDEMVIAASANGDIKTLEDLKSGHTIAMADNKDVKLIGLRLLEAVDLEEFDLHFNITETYQASARKVIRGEVEAAFFLAEVYHKLSKLSKAQLNVLIESDLSDICHVILIKDDFEHTDVLKAVILSLQNSEEGERVLEELGMPKGFEAMSEEDAEFMIDLMETLLD